MQLFYEYNGILGFTSHYWFLFTCQNQSDVTHIDMYVLKWFPLMFWHIFYHISCRKLPMADLQFNFHSSFQNYSLFNSMLNETTKRLHVELLQVSPLDIPFDGIFILCTVLDVVHSTFLLKILSLYITSAIFLSETCETMKDIYPPFAFKIIKT